MRADFLQSLFTPHDGPENIRNHFSPDGCYVEGMRSRFPTIISLYLRNDTSYGHIVTNGGQNSFEPGYLRLNLWAKNCYMFKTSSRLLLVFLKIYMSFTCLLYQIQ